MSDIKDFFSKDENVEEAITECEESTNQKGSFKERNYIKLNEGDVGNKLRILPPMAGKQAPWHHIRIHFSLVGPSGKKFPVRCSLMDGDKCPMCDESRMFREQGDKNKSWNAASKDQFIYNVVDEHGVFGILTVDKKLQQELIKAFKFALSEDGGKYKPWDLESGCYLKIVKTKGKKVDGQKFAPNVYAVHLLARKPLDPSVIESAPTSMVELDKIYRVFTVAEINGMLDGTFDPFEKKDKPVQAENDEVMEMASKVSKKMLEDAI